MVGVIRKITSQIAGVISMALHRSHGSFMASSAAVQLLPLISAPIVARLYAPEAFGAYAVFYALVALIGSSASLALHNAVLLEDNDSSAAHAALLSLVVSAVVSMAVAMTLYCIPHAWLNWAFGVEATAILPWLSATVLASSAYLSIYSWCVRKSYYSRLARNKLILGVSTMIIQIGIGLVGFGAIGFVWANLLGYVLALFMLIRLFADDMASAQHGFTLKTAARQFRRHIALPLYTVPATLINTLSSQLPELMINKLFGAHMLGQYSLANRMVNMPLSFLASSVQDIFRQKASAEFNVMGNCRATYRSFFVLMLLASIILLVPIVLVIPVLFPIIFGSHWDQSGHLIRAMVFLLAVRFISSPLSYVWIIRGRLKMDLLWQIGLLLVSSSTFLLLHIFFQGISLTETLLTYSTMAGFWYMLCIFISYRYSR